MEKNNGKVIAIVALVVAVIALSAGFAAFTAVLNITNASATIKASDTFEPNVNYVTPNSAICYKTGDTNTSITGATAGTASAKIWSGISVPLTKEIPSVTCEATIENASSFIAYLQTLTTSGPIECSSVITGTGAVTSEVLNTVCGATTMTVHVGNASPTEATDKILVKDDSASQAKNGTTSIAAKDGTNGTQKVYVTVSSTTEAISAADGDIKVALPYIELTYRTVANN